MILVDTSVWVDHFRGGDAQLVDLLKRNAVIMHPFVVGEIACGSLTDRALILGLLQELPGAVVALPDEVFGFIERHHLAGMGIGYVDVHLLASVALGGTKLWTRDKRLGAVAEGLDVASYDSGAN